MNLKHSHAQAERLKTAREREERMVLSAWYEMGMHVHKKGLEERLQPQVRLGVWKSLVNLSSVPKFAFSVTLNNFD